MPKFGFAVSKITPGVGVQLAGFIGERKAIGVHDDLFAKALYINFSEANRYLFIVLDTLAVFSEMSEKISKNIESKTGIGRDHILISATHTHSGPEGLGSIRLSDIGNPLAIVGKENDKIIEYTVDKTIAAALEAVSYDYEGDFMFASIKFKEKVCGSRREEHDANPMESKILMLKATTGESALVYNFGCHPTVLHDENLYISADFPGALAAQFKEAIPELKLSMFVNGAAGDISTRFYRKESSFSEVERIAKSISNNILSGFNLLRALKLDEKHFAAKIIPIKLKIKKFPSEESIQSILNQATNELEKTKERGLKNLRLYQSKVEGANALMATSRLLSKAKYIDTFIKLIVLDDIIFVGIPGELFSSLGKQIEKSLEPNKVILAGYCWDYIGYIPDAESYEKGGYETLSTLLEKGEGEKIVETIVRESKALFSLNK
jgi:hypothetical protein